MKEKYQKAIRNIQKELKQYINMNNIGSLVIGISGGIDSALCAVLAYPVCKELSIPLIGRSITIESNTVQERERAVLIGSSFCTDFKEVDLTDLYNSFEKNIEDTKPVPDKSQKEKIRLGNIKARIRMIYLYDLAQKTDGMVLSTDNKTEFLVGFWTLHGDVGDYGMIQNLWKTEVYELADFIVSNSIKNETTNNALVQCINAVPTDGLGITDSDFDQLGVSTYQEADQILKSYLSGKETKYGEHPVILRHKKTAYKRINPFNIDREKIFKE